MPAAAVVRGIIVSISILTALGIAVLENPQVQSWLEEQRRKIAELLRSIGEELDPESRRAAEAFAFEGRTPVNDEGLRREASGARDAAALATGRSIPDLQTVRRVPIQGSIDPQEAEERRRKGREYLAQRNQQMHELQQRRKATQDPEASTPTTPTFDSLVDDDGKLRTPTSEEEKELPSPPNEKPFAQPNNVECSIEQPLLASSLEHAWIAESRLSNPFSDEHELERSQTPRPPVPPKIRLDELEPQIASTPGSFTQNEVSTKALSEEELSSLSSDEQMALALALSESESAKAAAEARQTGEADEDNDDAELKAAIAASLREVVRATSTEPRMAAGGSETPRATSSKHQPLVDLTPPNPWQQQESSTTGQNEWGHLFGTMDFTAQAPSRAPRSVMSDTTEDLYSVTPQLTRARLATLNSRQTAPPTTEYEPARETAERGADSAQFVDGSFYSAASSIAAGNDDVKSGPVEQLIDMAEPGARTPTSERTFGFQTDSGSEELGGRSRTMSPGLHVSRPESALSGAEFVDAVDDSDVDMLSEEGDGILTPDSWTEVGSRDGEESEAEEGHRVPVTA